MRQFNTCREYLESYRELVVEARRLRDTQLSLWEGNTGTTANYSGMPGGGSEYSDSSLVAFADADEKTRARYLEAVQQKQEIEDFVDHVPGDMNRIVLRLRYLKLLDWDAVVRELDRCGMQYSMSYVYAMHKQAIIEAEKLWEVWNETPR